MVHLRVNSMNPKGAAYFREAGFRNVEVKDVLEIVTLIVPWATKSITSVNSSPWM